VKVLFLHQHFKTPYGGGAVRSYYLARALSDRGIETVVITTHSGPQHKKENVDGIEVHYLPIPYDNRFGFYKRSLSFVRFVYNAVQLTGKLKDIDLCYAISVPLTIGIAARKIQSRFKIPFLFEVGDLWPEAPIQMGFIKNSLLQNFLYKLEKKIYTSAKAIVALSTAIESEVKKKAVGKSVHLIPNMSDTEFFTPEAKHSSLVKKFNVEGKFVVSYIGAIGVANGLEYMLECARVSSEARLAVHFILCGDGAVLDHLKNEVTRLKLDNFSIIPFQTRDGVKEILNVTDAAFISYKPVPVLETGSPNKYFDGLASGKMIIVNFGGWIRNEIESNQCGIYVDPFNPHDFAQRISSFLKNEKLLKKYQEAARLLAEEKYSRKILSEKFYHLLAKSSDNFKVN
jgi:glycosyltransferase involved in cell wall biosynthesis